MNVDTPTQSEAKICKKSRKKLGQKVCNNVARNQELMCAECSKEILKNVSQKLIKQAREYLEKVQGYSLQAMEKRQHYEEKQQGTRRKGTEKIQQGTLHKVWKKKVGNKVAFQQPQTTTRKVAKN